MITENSSYLFQNAKALVENCQVTFALISVKVSYLKHS